MIQSAFKGAICLQPALAADQTETFIFQTTLPVLANHDNIFTDVHDMKP
jgi:hypothetical protein